MTIKDAFQFGIEPVRITDTDNIQINEGLPTEPPRESWRLNFLRKR